MTDTLKEAEDLKIYFYDNFLSSDQFNSLMYNTGYITYAPFDIALSTGVAEGSYARLSYKGVSFNPLYSNLIVKSRFSDKSDMKAFIGFKSTLLPPASVMVESHSGIYIENGSMYLTTGDGFNQQKIRIDTIDITKSFEFKISNNLFFYKPLPQIEIYLGMPTIKSVDRKWYFLQALTNIIPKNQVHYIMFWIGNTVSTEKYLYLNKVIYEEAYAD